MPRTEDQKLAAKRHDMINLCLISMLTALTLYLYAVGDPSAEGMMQRAEEMPPPLRESAWLTWGALFYSAFDIGYIFLQPCVTNRSRQLYLHHSATLVLAILGLLTKTESMTAKCLLVEVNTVILTIQKMFRIRSLQPLMLATWGFYRLLWYPYLTYQVCYYLAPSTSRFSFAVWIQTMICFAILNCLNLYWTLEFVQPSKKNGKIDFLKSDTKGE